MGSYSWWLWDSFPLPYLNMSLHRAFLASIHWPLNKWIPWLYLCLLFLFSAGRKRKCVPFYLGILSLPWYTRVPGWVRKCHAVTVKSVMPVKLALGFRRKKETLAVNLFSGRETKQTERQLVTGDGFLCLAWDFGGCESWTSWYFSESGFTPTWSLMGRTHTLKLLKTSNHSFNVKKKTC